MNKVPAIIFLLFLLSCKTKNNSSRELKQDSTDYKKAQELVLKKAEPAFIKAYTEISELKNYIKLAEEGVIKRTDVVKYYNKSVGLTMGELSKFSDVKTRIDTAGDAYVQYKWKIEAARIANEMAAEKKVEAERLKQSN